MIMSTKNVKLRAVWYIGIEKRLVRQIVLYPVTVTVNHWELLILYLQNHDNNLYIVFVKNLCDNRIEFCI
jgi:hypothetical protein